MREILFRGKFGNEWKYGFLSIEPQGLVIKEPYKNDSSNVWHIESDTIGQYTGFTDKNGAKIFEGDILAFDDMDGSKGIYEVFWDGNNGKFAIAASGNRNYGDDFELFERNEYFKWFTVIGNIYDSPRTFKGVKIMTRYELERHLGKYVEIVLFDGTVIEGILHKTGEKAFENDANLSIPKLRYFCTCGDKVVSNCVFRLSHIKKTVV